MNNRNNIFFLPVLICLLLISPALGNAAKNIHEEYCEVGDIISVNYPHPIYNADNKEIVELIEREPGVFAIRCIKPGDVNIYVFFKDNGTLYRTQILVHITEKKVPDEKNLRETDAAPYLPMSSDHEYYNENISAEQAAQADSVARSIANRIMRNANYKTDLQKVKAATEMVAQYAAKGTYGTDANKYYRTPYGVFITGNLTCAGTTRALGRVLEFMGYEWKHANENEWKHQWCILNMDGKIGYADAAVIPTGYAGYGTYQH